MISYEYQQILKNLNGTENFGKRKSLPKHLDYVIDQIQPTSILDFGCGTGALVNTLKSRYLEKLIEGYDPGNSDFSNKFDDLKFDLLISTDVLEHIEPEFLDTTLNYLKQKSTHFYHLIALAPSTVVLPDGRNAHLIIETKEWWRNKFLNQGCKIIFEKHMHHKKDDRVVNKYIISGSYKL